MNFFRTIYILLAVLLFAACTSSDDCREETDVKMRVSFFTRTYNATTNLYSNTALSIDSLWVNGLGQDSFLYKNAKSVKSILLPLKINSEQSEFIVRFNNTTDTIVFFHENNSQYFLSLECGCIVAHTIQEAVSTKHYADSISIINQQVINSSDAAHIQIFN